MIDPRAPSYDNHPVSKDRPAFAYESRTSHPPIVSFVTPFFETGDEFRETAKSILGQSLQAFEWIVVNDGSTSNRSLALLDECVADPRVKVVHLDTNHGPGAARNQGIAHATTDFVVFVDSDDLLEPTAAEKWLWYLLTHPEAAFVGSYTVAFGGQEHLWTRGFHDGPAFLEENLAVTTTMIRKATAEGVGGFDDSMRSGLEDWEFWLRCAARGYWGWTLDEFLTWYRRRATHGDRWDAWDGAVVDPAVRKQLLNRFGSIDHARFRLARDVAETAAHDHAPAVSNPLRKTRPRLLMIVPWLVTGGSDKFNLDLVSLLSDQWDVTIATTLPSDDPWLAEFTSHTPDVFRLHAFLPATWHPNFLSYLIDSRDIDVVLVSNSDLGYGILAWLRRCHPDVVFLDYCHMEQEDWKHGGYPMRAVEHQTELDLNVVSSAHLRSWMTERGADPIRIQVCYTNIDSERWAPDPNLRRQVRDALGIDSDLPVVLYAGRICAQKQPHVFAKTIESLRDRSFTAVVAGDGEDAPWLRSYVEENGLSRLIRFEGTVSNDRTRDLMIASDIFFLPSRWEGIALTLFEAMASGCVVVGADVGGQRELVTPQCGILIQPGSATEEVGRYTEALSSLLRDAAARAKMAAHARERVVQDFSIQDLQRRFVQLLEQARGLHHDDPRPLPDPERARAEAAAAVRESALEAEFARRRTEVLDGRMRARLYRSLVAVGRRVQRSVEQRGWTRTARIGRAAKRALDRRVSR